MITYIQVIVIGGTKHDLLVVVIGSNVIVIEVLLFYYNRIFQSHIQIQFHCVVRHIDQHVYLYFLILHIIHICPPSHTRHQRNVLFGIMVVSFLC